MRRKVASEADVPLAAVKATVEAASVKISFTITAASEQAADAAREKLADEFASNVTATAFFRSTEELPDLTVEAIDAPPTVAALAPAAVAESPAPAPPPNATLAEEEEGGLFRTVLESLEQWEIYEFAALGAAVLLCCCCCVACICRKRLMRCCGRCSPCCPCSHDLEASRPSRASRILRDNAKGREKRERKKEKKEKKEKRPKKKGERDLKGSEVAIDPGRGCKPRLPSMCVGVLDPTPRGPGAVSAPSAPSDWEEFEDDASGQKYWYNQTTGETTWEQPAELNFETPRGALTIPRPPALPPPPPAFEEPAAGLPPGWEELVDDDSGELYWHNQNTGETTWERPV
eukprot:Transcript_1845.p1 GENE.Transcript_1845~~Transcript_1845.p1  ORF type:complete len:346 (-),score=153.55 Transcript_1845:123-1160(-)